MKLIAAFEEADGITSSSTMDRYHTLLRYGRYTERIDNVKHIKEYALDRRADEGRISASFICRAMCIIGGISMQVN